MHLIKIIQINYAKFKGLSQKHEQTQKHWPKLKRVNKTNADTMYLFHVIISTDIKGFFFLVSVSSYKPDIRLDLISVFHILPVFFYLKHQVIFLQGNKEAGTKQLLIFFILIITWISNHHTNFKKSLHARKISRFQSTTCSEI